MKNFRKLFTVVLMLALIVASLAACGKKEEAPEATPTPAETTGGNGGEEPEEEEATPTPTPAPRDLNGIDIVVGDWWSTGEEVIETQKQEDQKAYRDKLQADHNFTLTQSNLGAWGEYAEIFITSTMSGDPAADIFIMDQAMVPEPIKQGLMYPVGDLPSFNGFTDEKWNQGIKDTYTMNDKTYAFSEEDDTPGLGVFWNKRLFEEAGLDPELLYDLQANGEWTWDKFHELAKTLTRDTNSDGVTDTYGITCWQREIVKAAVFSNGTDYVRFNEETGRYENNQKSDEVLAAIQLAVTLYDEGLILPQPEDAVYTFFVDAFKTSQAAMLPAEWYRHTEFQEMEDDWGFVFFPVGPGPNAKMQTMYVGNVRVMPAGLDAQYADDVAFAYDKWVAAVPGYEDEEMDLTYYYSQVRDPRAVEETIIPMLQGQGTRSLVYMVPGLSFKHGSNEDNGGLGDVSAIEIAEAASAIYDGIINDFYAD
ncbi:extracellular solute-binding protein [Mobilitalea sibirica]|uniref:Extracellular solute-binding protein n=1 Tax=Mobilitalea sibirica TaxID=1462919 RepID=A0A8J7HBI6_9FIRM|nr:extracellular solute-binding protein [Mobilitalea sibirica]MBH1941141.1 extracellular solute-binding protein [Mobilitalea sibirica]